MPNAAARRVDLHHPSQAKAVMEELQQAADSLRACFRDLETILAKPVLDAGALTSVRLKLAGIRLTRGTLITKVGDLLLGRLTQAEEFTLGQLRSSHHRLLQVATVHTSKWTLDAIARDWPGYCRETRQLMRQWVTKAEREQRLVHPLIKRCVEN